MPAFDEIRRHPKLMLETVMTRADHDMQVEVDKNHFNFGRLFVKQSGLKGSRMNIRLRTTCSIEVFHVSFLTNAFSLICV